MPKISVILPVYNAERFVAQAIESILSQTYADFELIIINDGSTDGSEGVIRRYDDKRIRIISRKNKGLVASLNEGIAAASGDLIARMDADDVSHPDRFKLQYEEFAKDPSLAVCGTWAHAIDESGNRMHDLSYPPLQDGEIRRYMLRHNPFIHPSVMMRKEAVQKAGLYNARFRHIEDYELWTRLLADKRNRALNLPQFLLDYRITQGGITRSKNFQMRMRGLLVRMLAIKRLPF